MCCPNTICFMCCPYTICFMCCPYTICKWHPVPFRWFVGQYNLSKALDKNFWVINTLRPRQNGRHFTDAIFKCIFLYEDVWIPIWISLKFVPKGPINNIPALVQIMAWRRPGDKPLSEPMMVRLPTHICVTRPQWVNDSINNKSPYLSFSHNLMHFWWSYHSTCL